MTDLTYVNRRLSILIGLLIMDGTVLALGHLRYPDALVLAIATVVMSLPVVSQSLARTVAACGATLLAMIVLQGPSPALWAANSAICIHLLAMTSNRTILRQTWFQPAIIVASMISAWYALNAPVSGWRSSVLALAVICIMIATWLFVEFRRSYMAILKPLMMTTALVVIGAMLAGFLLAGPVSKGGHLVRKALGSDTTATDTPSGSRSGSQGNNGLDLDYNPEGSGTVARAYLAVQKSNAPAPQQYSQPFYLRTAGYSAFTGKRWLAESKGWKVIKDSDDGRVDTWTATDSPVHPLTTGYQVYLPEVRSPWLPALPGTVALNLGVVSKTMENGYYVPSRRGAFITYQGKASMFTYRSLPSQAMEPGDAPERYYQMPSSEIFDRLQELTYTVIGDASEPAEKIRRILVYLSANHTYLIQTDKNRATLENFLFGEKKGHCTLYATATTLMLRSAGIPARMAVGFCGGKLDPGAGVYMFDSSSAHAWSEIKTRDHGWIILDPTPPATTEPPNASGSDFSEQLSAYSDLERERMLDPLTAFEKKTFFSNQQIQMGVLFLLLLTSFISFTLMGRRNRAGKGILAGVPGAVNEPLTDFFGQFCHAFAKRGALKRPYQTGFEYLRFLKKEGHIGGEWDDMLSYYYSVRYEGTAPSESKEKGFLERIKQLGET